MQTNIILRSQTGNLSNWIDGFWFIGLCLRSVTFYWIDDQRIFWIERLLYLSFPDFTDRHWFWASASLLFFNQFHWSVPAFWEKNSGSAMEHRERVWGEISYLGALKYHAFQNVGPPPVVALSTGTNTRHLHLSP